MDIEGVGDQLCPHAVVGTPPERHLRVFLFERAQVHVTVSAGQIGAIGGPHGVDPTLVEPLPDQIGRNEAFGSTRVVTVKMRD
ncbi:hypothetical protein R3Q06_35995 [Rhodococcus erythropolis]|uniref:hypothetical protein n=1 Tax=Rhodococcus erythropolis TaxID=1833 RepID=UPI0029499540|nr:hypothetical protein [Rhodococcus erythropolis]MDV6278772.1 hypothetical protein [Rhodococcus erythropolis]